MIVQWIYILHKTKGAIYSQTNCKKLNLHLAVFGSVLIKLGEEQFTWPLHIWHFERNNN